MKLPQLVALFRKRNAEVSALLLFLFSLLLRGSSVDRVPPGWGAAPRKALETAFVELSRLVSRAIQDSDGYGAAAEMEAYRKALDRSLLGLKTLETAQSKDDRQAVLSTLQPSILALESAARSLGESLRHEAGKHPDAEVSDAVGTALSETSLLDLQPGVRAQVEAFLVSGAHQSLTRVGRVRAEGGTFVPGAWPAVESALFAPDAQSHVEGPIPPSPNLLISLPRSGLNWVRYCTERLTGLRTPGTKRLVGGDGELAFHRSHRALSRRPFGDRLAAPLYDKLGKPLYQRIAIILRNPCESFIRHAEGDVRNLLDLLQNLEAFDGFPGPKHCLYYEEIVQNVEPIRELIGFFGLVECAAAPQSAEDVEQWSSASRELYSDRFGQAMGSRSYVPGKGFDTLFHSRRLPAEQRDSILQFLRGMNKSVFDKYLNVYIR